MTSWGKIKPFLGEHPLLVATLAAASVISGLTESGILAVLAQVGAALVDGASSVRLSFGPIDTTTSIRSLLIAGFALAGGRLLLQMVISYLPARIAADLLSHLRNDLFATFTRASWAAQSRDREGHLQELMMSQSGQAAQGALNATNLLVAVLTFAVLIVSAFALNILAAIVVLAAAVGLSLLLRPLHSLGRRQSQEWSRTSMSLAGGVGESVRLTEEAHVFGVGYAQRTRIADLMESVYRPFFQVHLLIRLVPGLYQSAMYLLVMGGIAALYGFGSHHVASLSAVILLLVRAGSYGQLAQTGYQSLLQSLPYIERVRAAREYYVASTPDEGQRALDAVEAVAFDDVAFAYDPARPVLSGIDFEIPAGEAVGILGPSGAGKSTLLQILLRLRPPSTGRYLVNGKPADEFAASDWHRSFSYVPQDPQLIHASVADNIRFYRDIPDMEIERAARLAGIHDDIMSWPEGYATLVGPRADAVSGGQQQRLCLARALASRPSVLILDEPTSALDPNSEALIQESLTALKDELTLFVVAHRISTLEICDRFIVIVNGRLETFTTAGALRDASAYFRSVSLQGGATLAEA